jgi:hypothetical protein
MKKILLCVVATCLSLALFPVLANAASDNVPSVVGTKPAEPADSVEAKTLVLRIDENKMDKTNMKSSEKKALRKEVKSINNTLRDSGGYVYLSAGAVILIVILLIILL